MKEPGIVVAFAGPIGSRKSELSREFAERLHWERRSFGDYLRELARKNGRDPEDRSVLQQLGQSSVQSNVDEFVENVLGGINWDVTRNVVLDGLRHAEVRHALLLYLRDRNATLKVVYVDMSEREREESEKKRGVSLRQLTAYNKDLTEAQIYNVIPAYADLRVPGSLPRDLAVDMIVNRLSLGSPSQNSAQA